MRKIVVFLTLALAVYLLPLFFGCSVNHDDNPVGVNDTIPGGEEPPDEGFILIDELLSGGAVELDYIEAQIAMGLADYIMEEQGAPAYFKPVAVTSGDINLYIMSLETQGYWYVFTISAMIVESYGPAADTIQFSGVDSVRFSNGSGFTMTPDGSTLTGLNARTHHGISISSQYMAISAVSHNAFDFTSTDDGALFDATSTDTLGVAIEDESVSCTFSIYASQVWNDIVINDVVTANDECPPGGTVAATAFVSAECLNASTLDGMSVTGSWSLGAVFNNGLVTFTYTYGNDSWTITDSCGSGGGGVIPDDSVVVAPFDTTYVNMFSEYAEGDGSPGIGNAFMATLAGLSAFDTTLAPFGEDPPFDTDYIDWTYNEQSGWFVFYLTIYDTNYFTVDTGGGPIQVMDWGVITAIDSVRVYDNGSPMAVPDALADSLHFRAHWEADFENSLGGVGSERAHYSGRSHGTPWNVVNYALWGTGADTTVQAHEGYYGGDDVCTLTVTASAIMSEVVVPAAAFASGGDVCPASGGLFSTLSVDWSCGLIYDWYDNAYDITGPWNLSETFNGGTSTVTYSYGGENVTMYRTCGNPSAAAKLRRLFAR